MNTYFTPAELAKRWHIHIVTLSNWRAQGRGPAYVKLGSKVLYPVDVIEAYEQAGARQPGKEAAQ